MTHETIPKIDKQSNKLAPFIIRSVMTLFHTPPHETIHKIVEDDFRGKHQVLQPNLDLIIAKISQRYNNACTTAKVHVFSAQDLLNASAIMVQFSEYSESLVPAEWLLPYENVEELHRSVIRIAVDRGYPLDFSEQFDIALTLCQDDVFKTLYSLFITSRTYARWLDEPIINSKITDVEQIRELMSSWRRAIAACKDIDKNQDPAGDAYYCWTHALAQVVFAIASDKYPISSKIGRSMFRNGTNIMHTVVHSVNKQTIPSDHREAAKYGNAIGCVIAEELTNPHTFEAQL